MSASQPGPVVRLSREQPWPRSECTSQENDFNLVLTIAFDKDNAI